MDGWNSGYVSDINYTHGFYRELTPALLSFLATTRGRWSPSIANALTYCELGCGQGLSANVLAAANPHIQFHATDFNPSQIVGAKILAAQGDLTNIQFYDDSFEEFAKSTKLPEQFDIIALHGIYSWISTENRARIVEFIRQRLKVGGLVYMSYNALPGWAQAAPIRRLFVEHAASSPGTTSSKVEAALNFANRVLATNAKYFAANPAVGERLAKLAKLNRNYLAHEYFNKDWTPFYASDVFAELNPAKLSFLGSAGVLDHVDEINLTPDQRVLLQEIADVGQRETLRDFFVNQQFRRDVFQRGAVDLPPIAARDLWLDTRFVLSVPKAEFEFKVKGQLGEGTLQAGVYAPLVDAFAEGPKSLRDFIAGREIDANSWAKIVQACLVLVGSNRLEPCLPSKDEAKRLRHTRAFNNAVLMRARENADIQYLASPVTGGGLTVGRFQQLFLLAIQNNKKTAAELAEFVWKILSAQGQAILKEGVALTEPEDNLKELRLQAEDFTAKHLPLFKNLQIA